MKKFYISLFALMAAFLANRASAQMYTAGDITVNVLPSMNHDSSSCSSNCMVIYMITVNNSFVNDSIFVVDTNSASLIYAGGNTTGALSWTMSVPIPMYTPVITDDNLMGGMAMFMGPNVKIKVGSDIINAIPNMYSLIVANPCQYGSVSGRIYVDNNSDCSYNSGDDALNGIAATGNATLSGGSTTSYAATGYSDATGSYSMRLQESWMTGYTVSIPSWYSFLFGAPACAAGSYSFTTLPQTNVDFALLCTTSVDVECWAGSPANARPDRPFFMHPYVSNTGCDLASGELVFIKDSRVDYNASLSSMPATTVSGDTLKWSYSNLTNLSGGAYWNNFVSSIHLTPNSTVTIGDTLCFRVYTNVPTGDINSANNDYTICLPVVNSYDPNIKEVSPAGVGAEGFIPATTPDLTYTIHFQNTGTDYAYNVYIMDTLDVDVNPSTLKILGNSHAMTPEWVAPGVVKFNFAGIYLADSFHNEPASHGYVRFSVKPDAGLTPGTQIKNKAYIYFDSNPAVITNTALNTIGDPASVPVTIANNNVRVYPNPATDELYIEGLQDGSVTLWDVKGAVVLEQNVTSANMSVNISRLASGVYILKTSTTSGSSVTRVVKQ